MKLFRCQHCGQVLYFDNVRCEQCGHRLGYMPERTALSALEPDGQSWRPLATPGESRRLCDNAAHDACNWLVPPGSDDRFCTACRHNHVVPNLTLDANLLAWRKLEWAKHRLFYTLLRLKLPLANRADNPQHGLIFDFLADPPAAEVPKVLTGHDEGLITIALAEADDAEREKRRVAMGEPYRTLLGHFRHEVGHYYWDRLVADRGRQDACRAVFGDDRIDYGEALQRHYENGAPPDWCEHYVSVYATTHPWEDFAETWAHYLHIVDTLEMARAFGLSIHPKITLAPALSTEMDVDPYAASGIDALIRAWLPLTFAANSLNRCMGAADLYPFVLPPPVIRKLGFIHDLVHEKV